MMAKTEKNPEIASIVLRLAQDMIMAARQVSIGQRIRLSASIGIDVGAVVSRVDEENQVLVDVWGEVLIDAKRLQHTAPPGRVHVSRAFVLLMGDGDRCSSAYIEGHEETFLVDQRASQNNQRRIPMRLKMTFANNEGDLASIAEFMRNTNGVAEIRLEKADRNTASIHDTVSLFVQNSEAAAAIGAGIGALFAALGNRAAVTITCDGEIIAKNVASKDAVKIIREAVVASRTHLP